MSADFVWYRMIPDGICYRPLNVPRNAGAQTVFVVTDLAKVPTGELLGRDNFRVARDRVLNGGKRQKEVYKRTLAVRILSPPAFSKHPQPSKSS